MLLGIGVVDAVDTRRLEDHLGADLHGPQAGGRVGGEEWVARAGREDHHAALLEMPGRAAADIGLGHLLHLDRRQHPGGYADLLERVLEGQRVDDGGEHAHVVAGGAVHTARAARETPEDVAAADDERELAARRVDLAQLPREAPEQRLVDAIARRSRKRLPAELQENAAITPGARRSRPGLRLRARLQRESPLGPRVPPAGGPPTRRAGSARSAGR